jgi:hypothetical protein
VETIGVALGASLACSVVLAWLLIRAKQNGQALRRDLERTSSAHADSAAQAAAEQAKRVALEHTVGGVQAARAATEEIVSVLTKERDELRQRLKPVLDLEAERLRLAATLAEDRSQLERESQQAYAAAEGQRRALESEITAARHAAAQETSRAQQEARRAFGIAHSELEDELAALRTQREQIRLELRQLEEKAATLRGAIQELDEAATLQSFGYYYKRYGFGTSAEYERLLEQVCNEQKVMVKAKAAATCPVEWAVNGSKREGQKQINQTLRLMLRAFNGEADAAIAKVTYKNFAVMEKRIQKAFEAINGLAEVQQCRLSPNYLNLRLQELVLVHEHQEKLYEERQEQRRIRERMRDEEIAQRQLEKAQREAEEDERQYEVALEQARLDVEQAHGAKQARLVAKVAELERRLEEAHANKERAVARAQLTRSGHVYVISNIGSFGEHVYKIGMTRRLDPLERIHELGDASVPFEFDVHAVIFAEDAPALETELHRAFADRRINRVNERKEFFKVSIEEIAFEVRKHRAEIMITMAAEAEDYRKTLAAIAELEQAKAALVTAPLLTA